MYDVCNDEHHGQEVWNEGSFTFAPWPLGKKVYMCALANPRGSFVCLFLVFTEGALTKVEFENKALRHNAASQE
jgi:hypothetical protein